MSRTSFASRNAAAPNAKIRTSFQVAPCNLRLGDAGDHLEREADRMADLFTSGDIVRRDWSLAQVSADTASRPLAGSVAPAPVHDVLVSPGKPLDEPARAKFESGIQHDLSQVRIHVDDKAAESAESVKALAYTVGNDVVFGRGQYQPGSSQGDRLLAHELAHTVQQERSAERVLQRQDAPEKRPTTAEDPGAKAVPAPAQAQVDVRNWPTKLPRAQRKERQEQIKKVPDKLELENTAIGGQKLDADQQAIVDKIKTNREQLAVYPWLKVVPAEHRVKEGTQEKEEDKKGGFFYPGVSPKTGAAKQRVRKEIAAELGKKEGELSAINTYDDAYLTLGPGLTAALLSMGMERFFSKDEEAKNKFLDAGVAFTGGRLLMVNTENGAVEEDPLRAGDNAPKNARVLFSISQPLVSLFVHLAESKEHGPLLKSALQQSTPALHPPAEVESWTDIGAVRLAAHLIHWRSASWSLYSGTGGNVTSIMKAFGASVRQDPKVGNAHVLSSGQGGIVFGFAGGKAKEAFGGPIDVGEEVAPNSLSNKLLVQVGGTSYLQLTL